MIKYFVIKNCEIIRIGWCEDYSSAVIAEGEIAHFIEADFVVGDKIYGHNDKIPLLGAGAE